MSGAPTPPVRRTRRSPFFAKGPNQAGQLRRAPAFEREDAQARRTARPVSCPVWLSIRGVTLGQIPAYQEKPNSAAAEPNPLPKPSMLSVTVSRVRYLMFL
jgi:hypothetical protein